MSVWMLRADYLEYIHDAMVAVLWPGTDSIRDREQRDRALIESAAARPFHTLLGVDAYPTILEKGVALFHSVNSNHAFINGNKRTAVIAIDHFLMANDHQLLLQNDAMYKIAEKTAGYKRRGLSQAQSLAEIREALEENVISIDIVEKSVGQQAEFLKLIETFKKMRELLREKACRAL
jgi:prophage maintenance system killer protein